MIGLKGLAIPPPPPGMSARTVALREARLRRLGLTLHRMHMQTLTAERHDQIMCLYPSAEDASAGTRVSDEQKRAAEQHAHTIDRPRQEQMQRHLQQRHSRPASCAPTDVRRHYDGIFPASDARSTERFSALGVPLGYPAFYGVRCEPAGLVLDVHVAPVRKPETQASNSCGQQQQHAMPPQTASGVGLGLDFTEIRARCNARIRDRVAQRAFT